MLFCLIHITSIGQRNTRHITPLIASHITYAFICLCATGRNFTLDIRLREFECPDSNGKKQEHFAKRKGTGLVLLFVVVVVFLKT